MEEKNLGLFISKINAIKNHNEIITLKAKQKKYQENIQIVSKEFQKILDNREKVFNEKISQKDSEIDRLKEINKKLVKEKEYLEKSIGKMPKFLIRLYKLEGENVKK